MTGAEWLLLAPLLATLATAVAALATDAVGGPRPALLVAAAGLALSAAAFAASSATQPIGTAAGVLALGGTPAALDAFLCVMAALSLAAGRRRLGIAAHGGQVAALVAFSTAACCVLLGAFDLGVFVVAIELVALCGYALVAAGGTDRAYEAATKYFVQGAVATGLLAYGVAILFGALGGSLAYPSIGQAVLSAGKSPAVAVAVVLMLSVLAFKLGAFPFHSWAPDAYETAPPAVAGYLASVPKLAALLAALMLLAGGFAAREPVWALLAAGLAVASVAFGNLGALKQRSVRRMLGYSGIAQVGYALTGIAAGSAAASQVMLFGLFYALAAGGAFFAVEAAGEGASWDGTIASLAGLGKRRPVLAASLTVCLLSLTGIPLTAGFWGKLLVFAAAASTNMLWLAVAGVIGSVVSFGYYGAVLRSVYLDETVAEPAPEPEGETEQVPAAEVAEILPRTVGAMAADDTAEAEAGPVWPAALIAATLVLAGVAPLFGGLSVFSFLAR